MTETLTIIESVRNYIKTYPELSGDRINVDFLPEKPLTYSVDSEPTEQTVKYFIDGSSIRQFIFVFATRNFYGKEIRQQIDNLGFFESFANWIEQNNRTGNLPDLTDGRIARTIKVNTSGYVFAPDNDVARYQIQCSLEYYQPAQQ